MMKMMWIGKMKKEESLLRDPHYLHHLHYRTPNTCHLPLKTWQFT